MERKDRTKSCNSSACNCALAAQLAANELEQLGIRLFAAGNFKMGGFRNSEAGRLNCYEVLIYLYKSLKLGYRASCASRYII